MPKKPAAEKMIQVGVRMTPSLRLKIKLCAKAERIGVGEYIRRAVNRRSYPLCVAPPKLTKKYLESVRCKALTQEEYDSLSKLLRQLIIHWVPESDRPPVVVQARPL